MRIARKQTALGVLAGMSRAGNESGSVQQVTSGSEISTALRRRQVAPPRPVGFDRRLSWQLDAARYLEESANVRLDRWLARLLRGRLETRLPRRGR